MRWRASGLAWRLVATALVAMAGGGIAAQEARQEPGRMPVFRAGVELVVFHVAVLDEDGEPVTDLDVTDFRVSQGGEQQKITLFATPDASPLDVALVLDSSSSIADSAPRIREDAMAFLEALGANDCVYFVPFAERVGDAAWAHPRDPVLAARIGGMDLVGGTALYDALIEGLQGVDRRDSVLADAQWAAAGGFEGPDCGRPLPALAAQPGQVRRTAVVVLSDGGDEHSLATYADALGVARMQPIPIHAVAVGDAVVPRPPRSFRQRAARAYRRRRDLAEQLTARLDVLTAASGGRLIVGDAADSLMAEFDTVIAMLRSSYLVGYRPPEDAAAVESEGLAWHAVELAVPQRDVVLFARPGYYRASRDTDAAQRLVQESVRQLADDAVDDALRQLVVAGALDSGYWPIYLQQARAHVRRDELVGARDALLRGLELRPGTVPMNLLLATTAFDLADYELAWQHAIRAHQGGALVTTLLRRLEEAAPPPADLQTQLRAARAYIDIGRVPPELDQGTLVRLVRSLRRAVDEAPDLALMEPWNAAELGIILDVDSVEGSPRRLQGELTLTNRPYEPWEDENVRIGDVDDPASIAAAFALALESVRDMVNDLR